MNGLVNPQYVTGPADSDTAGLVGSAHVAPSSPSSTGKGKRSGSPTHKTQAIPAYVKHTDNGQPTATLAPDLRPMTTVDKYNEHEDDKAPLRLRGGNGGSVKSDDDMDLDPENQAGGVNNPKRFKSSSPEPYSQGKSGNIEAALNNIDTTLNNIRTYMMDVVTATKIGKKWAFGMEDFLTEVLVNTKKIAFEAVEAIGANKQLGSELRETKHQINALNIRIGELSVPGREIDSSTRLYSNVTEGTKSQTHVKQATRKIDDFPTLESQLPKKTMRKAQASKKKDSDMIKKAKMKPVKPAFTIDGQDKNLKIDDIWKIVSSAIPYPKVDGCRRTADGNYVLTSSDKATTEAIRSINAGLSIKEKSARKPRVKIKGIPIEYTPEFIAETMIKQNETLVNCTERDIRPLFKCGHRNEFNNDWVIEVSPKAYKAINGVRTYVGMVSSFPRPFTMAPHCRRCLQSNHRTADCQADSATCFHCTNSGHNRKDCPNRSETPTCAHCKGPHATMSKECTKWAARVKALLQKTDYEYPNNE